MDAASLHKEHIFFFQGKKKGKKGGGEKNNKKHDNDTEKDLACFHETERHR